MPQAPALNPRKLPHQKRSTATVDAILEATIQVLLSVGASRLTTTRVADRAGVSVGTMYQYFPQKRALLYAVLQKHLETIAGEVEMAFLQLHNQPLSIIATGIANACFNANMRNFDISRAIYLAARKLDTTDFDGNNSLRTYEALKALLASTSDATFSDLGTVTFTLQQALSGVMRAAFECDNGTAPDSFEKLHSEWMLLCRSYLIAASHPGHLGTKPG